MMLMVAMLVGANTVVTRYLNALYARRNGLPMGTLANYVTGLATALLAMWALGGAESVQPVGALTFRTVMMFLGGMLGVALIQIFIYITPRLPAFAATLMIFVSQLAAGLVLDTWLTGVFSPSKLLGGVLVAAGLAHYNWVSNRASSAAPSPRRSGTGSRA